MVSPAHSSAEPLLFTQGVHTLHDGNSDFASHTQELSPLFVGQTSIALISANL